MSDPETPTRPVASDAVRRRVGSLPRRFRPESGNGLAAEWELRIGAEVFSVSLVEHGCFVREGPSLAPHAVITADPETWLAMDEGRLTGIQAFLERRLQVQGDLDLAVRLQTMFRPHRRARRPADLEQAEVTAGDVALSCYLLGEGPPLLLLHGLGASKISWLPVLQPLARRHRLIVPDFPGHGASDKPRADYTPRYLAGATRRLLDAVEVEAAVAVGNSLGGRVALELALRSPARVRALVLLAPSVPGLRWRYVMGLTRAFPSELAAVPFPLRDRWMRMALRRLFSDPGRLAPEALSVAAAEFIRIYRDPRARVAFLSSLRHIVTERPEPFFGRMRRVKQPALVLFGEHDRLVPPRLGVRLVNHLPNARFAALPAVGHVPQFEATEEVLALIGAFLEDVLPRTH